MRKFPFIIIGVLFAAMALAQLSITRCTRESNNNDTIDSKRDTTYICDDYDLDEEFYNPYHPDSVSVTTPEGFTYYTDYEVRKYGRFRPQLAYALGIMLPEASYPHSSMIAKWVLKRIEDDEAFRGEEGKPKNVLLYDGDLFNGRKIFDYMANRFFKFIDSKEVEDCIAFHNGITMTVEYTTPRFITYREDTDCYWGGVHGYYTEKYLTLDLTTGKSMGTRDLFRSEYLDSVKAELYKAASIDSAYLEAHNHQPGEDVSYIFTDDNGNFDLPQPALLENGVVYSFQPYEISGFAQGCFHFVIPYSNLTPYLTPRAKALIWE